MKQSEMMFSGPIDNTIREADLVLLNELVYQVDTVEIDDSYLQLGFTHREKDFLNLKSSKIFTVNRSQFSSPDIKNDPIYMFFFA
jgi:hypothetical protein